MKRHLRIALAARTQTDEPLMCLACGNYLAGTRKVDFAIVVSGGEPQVGLHKKCMSAVHAKRGASNEETTSQGVPS